MAVNNSYFSGMEEMPETPALLGEHRVGNAVLRGTGDMIQVDLGDDGMFQDEPVETNPDEFHENLAEYLYSSERMLIAQELIEYFDVDRESRQDWERRVEVALKMLGIEEEGDSAIPFKDASRVVHPGIGIACVQYQSRAIEEFFPPQGPVKAIVMGEETEERTAQAKRVEDFMNWYYTDGDKGYFPDTDQLLFKLPVQGSMFRKSYADPKNGRPMQRHVNGWDFIAPYNGQDLESMSRYCHRYYMNSNDIARAMDRGFFIDVELPKGNTLIRMTQLNDERPDDRADDRTPAMHDRDDVYEILEYHIDYTVPGVDEDAGVSYALPYIIFVERTSQQVLRIERNWKESDPDYEKRIWFTHYRYLPGLGFYGFGLLHIIGSLGTAATGAVRALLDAAARNALSGGFKSKDLKLGGEVTLEPGKWKDVDVSIEDMKNAFFAPPAPQNTEPLFKVLELLTNGIERFSSATETMVGDGPTNGPVGTTLAMIEQGSKVYSAIHKRTHASARHEFACFAQLITEFSPYEKYPYAVKGEDKVIFREDFDDRVDVIPVSDPNIWSSTQRIALAQAQVQVVIADPEIFGRKEKKEAYRRMFEALRVPEIERLLPPDEEAPEPYLDPVSENMRVGTGQTVKAWAHQDHPSHIAVHENWVQIQMATQPPEILDRLLPQIMAHIQEHKAYLYQQQVMQQLGMELPVLDVTTELGREPMPPELEAMLARAAATALLPVPDPEGDAETQAAMGEEERKDMAAMREQERRDAAAQREEARKDLKIALDTKRAEEAHQAQLRREARMAGHQRALEDAEHEQDMEHQEESNRLAIAAKKAQNRAAKGGNSATKK